MARTEFARLVRALIDQTNDQVVTLDMRSGEGAQVPGYDGIVVANRSTPFVPEGRSVWELGTGADPETKATDDYVKRTKEPLGEDPSKTTFVVVTPRRWTDKENWIKPRLAAGPWKDIKVLDVDNIEAALEQARGAHLIFSEQLGKAANGVRGIEEWWRRFSTASNPALTPEMVLVGRLNESSQLASLLEQDVRFTTISASGTDEILAFVAAVILAQDETRRLSLLARALVIHEAHALRLLDVSAKLLILIPYDEQLHREALLIRTHHVILLAPHDAPADIRLSRIDQHQFAKLLVDVGVEEARANLLGRAAGRSLIAFQREAATAGIAMRTQWTTWFRSRAIRLAWLSGGWNQDRSGDLDVLAAMIGRPYADFEADIREASLGEDPLFTRVGPLWTIASPEAAWEYAAPLVTPSDVATLERSLQTVLGAVDPALDLPLDQRWAAAVHGKERIHSANMRTGLATTLALLGAFGESVDLGQGRTARNWAEVNVMRLLKRANDDESAHQWGEALRRLRRLHRALVSHRSFVGA